MKGLGGLAALLVLVAACGAKPPPPPPPPPTPTPAEEPKVAAPPQPKCESLDEKCMSKDGTLAKIAKTKLSFAPPTGWIYAQTETATVAQNGDAGAMLVIAGWDPGDPKDKKAETSRDAQIEALMKQVNVGLKKKMSWKKKPDMTKEPAGLKVDLWDAGVGNRGDKKGTMIVLSAPIDGTKSLLGFGFVSDDDHSENETILKALDAITKGGK